MAPLTHQVWEKHFAQLREPVLTRFPQVDEIQLEAQGGDYDGLVALVQRATGLDADLAEQQIRALEVDDLGLGTGEAEEQDSGQEPQPASLAQLSLGSGFTPADREMVTERLSQLNRRLKRFPADGAWLELTVKDREATAQKVTLSADLKGFSSFVSTSEEGDMRAALADVRDDMIRQIGDAVDKRKGVR
jgi:ribosome-associated translation inhibitor RaiA